MSSDPFKLSATELSVATLPLTNCIYRLDFVRVW